MEPLSATASVLTLLAAAGSSCGFLHTFVVNIADAPQDIKRQNETLRCLQHTLMHLSQIYSNIPENHRMETPVHDWISNFAPEVSSIRSKVEGRAKSLQKGHRIRRIQESLRWIMFDRHLRKFYESLDHWNAVFQQACAAVQM